MDEDKKLYNEFLSGNKIAFDNLIGKYQKNVTYFISRYVKDLDAAEDIFQDVVLYLLENRFSYDSKYSFKSYLYIIAKSKAINYIKKHNVEEDISKYENNATQTLLEDVIFSNERKAKIQKVINNLKTDYQIVIYLTQIEGLSYKETSLIMDKTEKQVKNLVYNAKKSLKRLLIRERIIEMKNNKFIRLLSFILVVAIVVSGVVFATKVIIQKINNAKLVASFTGVNGDINGNQVWVGTFNLAWNELLKQLKLDKIEFEDGTPEIANELNKKTFTKDFLSKKDYYTVAGPVSDKLKKKIETDIQKKFNEKSDILDRVDWSVAEDHYLIYSMLKKEFTFEVPFPKRNSDTFGNSTEKVKYFGLDDSTIENTFDNVEALFYNSTNDFAVKINTKEGEELYLYRTDNKNSFYNLYEEMLSKATLYTGKKHLEREKDRLRIPFIKVNADINYDELCKKYIKGTNAYIDQAIQTVDFELNNYGGFVKSEALIDVYLCMSIEEQREFNFTDTFVLFMKEKDKGTPYFALLVNNTDVLVIAED